MTGADFAPPDISLVRWVAHDLPRPDRVEQRRRRAGRRQTARAGSRSARCRSPSLSAPVVDRSGRGSSWCARRWAASSAPSRHREFAVHADWSLTTRGSWMLTAPASQAAVGRRDRGGSRERRGVRAHRGDVRTAGRRRDQQRRHAQPGPHRGIDTLLLRPAGAGGRSHDNQAVPRPVGRGPRTVSRPTRPTRSSPSPTPRARWKTRIVILRSPRWRVTRCATASRCSTTFPRPPGHARCSLIIRIARCPQSRSPAGAAACAAGGAGAACAASCCYSRFGFRGVRGSSPPCCALRGAWVRRSRQRIAGRWKTILGTAVFARLGACRSRLGTEGVADTRHPQYQRPGPAGSQAVRASTGWSRS